MDADSRRSADEVATSPLRGSRFDLLLLLALSTLWAASYSFIRVSVETITPITLMGARTLLAGSILLCWMRVSGVALPTSPTIWRRLLVQSLLNSVVPFTLLAWAEQWVGAGLATILNSASPIMVVASTWLITKHETVSALKVFGVIVGCAGILLVVGPDVLGGLGNALLPELAIVLAAACYAAAAIYGRSFKGLSPAVPAAGSMLISASLLVPASLLFERPWMLHPSASSLVSLVTLSVFSTALAFVIYFRLIESLGSLATTAQALLRVPIGVLIGIVFLDERLASTAWVGLACVVAGVAAMTAPPRRSLR